MTGGELWMGVATIIAIIVGPVIAVIITRINDDRRAARARMFDVFRALMRTRRMPIHLDHVYALNLVEVEFVDHPKVVRAWKDYLANLGIPMPPAEQKAEHDVAVKRRDALLTKLISEIATALKIRVEQLDILEGNYVPQGWHDDDWENRLVRKALLNVLLARAPIVVQPPQPGGPYPPPPISNPPDET